MQLNVVNYLLKDLYIFDLAGTKEKLDEREIEEQLNMLTYIKLSDVSVGDINQNRNSQ
ncbi:hypothetical protein [Bacteroides acidifaciens]|jgi:hypothetical protein|uniref:hypothetical protein n=1 Tax=Bacteroides acidifaciens TaxID=85831 RepID=UPI0014343FD7|nr:hypothetical protein [Bacteroides acidifaciens]GFI00487.1 hypothetical protein IMSAGC004_02895 [Bacteroidaceae bacterium]